MLPLLGHVVYSFHKIIFLKAFRHLGIKKEQAWQSCGTITAFALRVKSLCHSRSMALGHTAPIKTCQQRPANLRSGPADITYNPNNVCNTGASRSRTSGIRPRTFSEERTNNQLLFYHITKYGHCQQIKSTHFVFLCRMQLKSTMSKKIWIEKLR